MRQLHAKARLRTRNPVECRPRCNRSACRVLCIDRSGLGKRGGFTGPQWQRASVRRRDAGPRKALPRGHRRIRYKSPRLGDRLAVISMLPNPWICTRSRNLRCRAMAISICAARLPSWTTSPVGLGNWGVAANHIHTEIFGSSPPGAPGIAAAPRRPPHQPAGSAGVRPLVSFLRGGLNVRWAPAFQSLLALAEACDVLVRWAMADRGLSHLRDWTYQRRCRLPARARGAAGRRQCVDLLLPTSGRHRDRSLIESFVQCVP
jgi:hypothetical protein